MPDVSALTLVNQVLTYHRFNEVSDFTENQSKAALQVVNMAIDKVLNSNDWDFARRHDGVLFTDAKVSSTVQADSNSGAGSRKWINFTGSHTLGTSGASVLRFVSLSSDLGMESGVAYPINYWDEGGLPGYNTTAILEHDLVPTGLVGTTNWTVYAAEYVLPTTVRGMMSATKQDSGRLDVEMISPEIRLEQLSTEPHGNISDHTRIIYQGGSARATYKSETENANTLGLRIILWPVPETRFKIDYSYWYLYPQMVAITDELEGISQSAIHDVVNYAYAHSNLTGIGNDPKLGTALKEDTRFEIAETRSSEKAAMSYDGRITPWGSIPRGRRGWHPRDRWDSQRIEVP